jgi:hypothetical protein
MRLREHYATDVGPFATADGHHDIIADDRGPRLEVAAARGIFHSADQALHATSRTRV